jgi:hypothetical protein
MNILKKGDRKMVGFGPAPVGFFSTPRRKGIYVVTSIGKDTVEKKKKKKKSSKKRKNRVAG